MKKCAWLSLLTALLCVAGCSSKPSTTTQPVQATSAATPTPASQEKIWSTLEKTDPMDGTKEVTFIAGAIQPSHGALIVRFKSKSLDVYVNTEQVLDDAKVRVKFDDGKPSSQKWSRSTDYRAVFAPEPFGFLMQLQKSTKFYIEYHPYEKVPETIIFNVTGLTPLLPEAEMAAQKKKYEANSAADAALRAKILPFVHPCRDKQSDGTLFFPGQWCWTDPYGDADMESSPSPTKDAALRDAMMMARMGIAFKKTE